MHENAIAMVPEGVKSEGLERLVQANLEGDIGALRLAIAERADLDEPDILERALWFAVLMGKTAYVEALLEAGAPANAALEGEVGETILARHLRREHALLPETWAAILEAMLRHGADPRIKDKMGRAASSWAKPRLLAWLMARVGQIDAEKERDALLVSLPVVEVAAEAAAGSGPVEMAVGAPTPAGGRGPRL